MAKNLFNRYIWIIDTIYRAGKITFKELNIKWLRSEMSEGKKIPLRTFHNQRNAIEQLFDINIECDDRNGHVYYIENIDCLKNGGTRSWLLNTFSVSNLINESHKLKHRILFESIPSGQRFLTPIIEAMKNDFAIEVTYQSFWINESCTFEIEPYCVKIFKQRWYVVARSPYYDRMMIYSLDRIIDLEVLDKKFKLPKDFNSELFFIHSFGIIVDSECDPEFVDVKVWGNKVKYFEALPLHQSQEVLEKTDRYTIFRYFLQPTYDLRQELLSHGNEIEILSPKWFRDEIGKISKELFSIYQ